VTQRAINVVGILFHVLVNDGVALVVVTLADQPTEDPGGIVRVGDAALGRFAVECGDVIPRN
jgi:hypothetical protein